MIGIDILKISEFKRRIKKSDLGKIFLPSELEQNRDVNSLAGIFTAKEAFFKAVGKKDDWLNVWVEKEASGQPTINSLLFSQNQKAQISISHDGDYAIAVVVIE